MNLALLDRDLGAVGAAGHGGPTTALKSFPLLP
jgi:hypothetical protein